MFNFHGFQKGTFWTAFSAKWSSKILTRSRAGRPFPDPAFHETTVILVPLGPSVFKNVIFSMMIGYFPAFSAFRRAMFYMSFLSHLLKKTTVNAQPLSPLIFEKIAPDFKNKVFYYFASLRLRFSPPYCGSLFFFAYSHLLPPTSLRSVYFTSVYFSSVYFSSLHFTSLQFTSHSHYFTSIHFTFSAGFKRGGALYLPGCVLLGRQCGFSP